MSFGCHPSPLGLSISMTSTNYCLARNEHRKPQWNIGAFLSFLLPSGTCIQVSTKGKKDLYLGQEKYFGKDESPFSLLLENSRKLQGFGLSYSSSGVMQGAEGQECQFTLDQRRGERKKFVKVFLLLLLLHY